MLQTIGKRIAEYRNKFGWTQQFLAERLGISRVAVSHIEMDISTPGERTITLLAGLFKIAPHNLVDNTTYPEAKGDRLPFVSCAYTPLECELAVMKNDLEWLDNLKNSSLFPQFRQMIFQKWSGQLENWEVNTIDMVEKNLVKNARKLIMRI